MVKDSRRCLHCTKRFKPKRKDQVYCKPSCRWKRWDEAHPRVGVRKKHKRLSNEPEEMEREDE